MNSRKVTSDIDESEPDFCRLLQEIQASRASSDVLLDHPIFKRRLRLITMAHARTAQDAEELANDVRVKVWQHLPHFKPDYTKPYGNFFSWLRVVTRNTFVDAFRRPKVEFDENRVEDLVIADPQIDIEASVLYKEVIAELEKSINALPLKERLAIAYYLQGFTFTETSEKIRQAGFSSSQVAVRNWIKSGLSAFFFKSGKPIKPGEITTLRNTRVTHARATRAKREFHTILEQAINSGTAAITYEDVYKTPQAPFVGRQSPKKTQTSLRHGWESAKELLKKMQTPESKQGIQAAFDASPEELGRAAVKHANKGRNVPVVSLTTFLMAASTVNVVGRVMSLSQDVA